MPSNLDKQLKELFYDAGASDHDLLVKSLVERAKAAFADEGYIQPRTMHPLDLAHEIGFMTGAEWYEKFEKECVDHLISDPVAMLAAGRRAAGLEGDTHAK